jgi:hypothetical protein
MFFEAKALFLRLETTVITVIHSLRVLLEKVMAFNQKTGRKIEGWVSPESGQHHVLMHEGHRVSLFTEADVALMTAALEELKARKTKKWGGDNGES